MKKLYITRLLMIALVLSCYGTGIFAQQTKNKPITLKHWMTPEEAKLKHLIGKDAKVTEPPDGPVTNIAEYDHMQSVLIRYSFGISYQLIAAMSEDCNVTTIVANQSEKTYVTNQYQNQGVNLDNCDFIIAPSNSYWTRDYGPWFIFDGNDEIGIMDFTYNRPRPQDNAIPAKVAAELNINLFEMDIATAGGNYMTDGMGQAASSDLIWIENSGYTHDEIDEIFQEYLGIDTYHVLEDPNNTYIDHIDCWGKYLDVDKVLIRSVPTSHPQYDEIEATAAYFEGQISSYGTPYQVFRVFTPNDQPYTNSLILNKRVFVPVTGSQWDDDAIASYEEAMPGYEVLGFTGSWQSTDALHCRTKGIADINMLHIRHIPLLAEQPVQADYAVEATLKAFSGQAIYSDSVLIWYRINGGVWDFTSMTNTSGQIWEGNIPGASAGSQIDYYLYAADQYGKRSTHPFIGEPDPHSFFVGEQAYAHIEVTPDTINVSAPVGGSADAMLSICNTGDLELNFEIETSTAAYGQIETVVPDSPSASSWEYNTYDETGWTDIQMSESGELANVEVEFNWSTDDWPEEGSLHLQSPAGTVAVLLAGSPAGNYTLDITDFEGEELSGDWKMWIEDTYGDGGHQATGIAVTFTVIESETEWMPTEPVTGMVQPGECADVTIPCNAEELTPGTWEGMITINSNDPENPVVEVPVYFEVTGTADVTVAPDTLWFLTMNDMIEGKMLYISNETGSDIMITDITEYGSNFAWMFEESLPAMPYNLQAGAELQLNVIIPPPPAGAEAMLYDDLTVTTGIGSQTVTIAWNDAVYQPNLAIAPDTLWFETPQQAWVDGLTFTIENTGNVPMDIFNVPLSGEIWEIQEPPVSFPYQMEVGETLELNVLITLVSPPDAYLYETFEIESMLGLSSVTVALNDVILGLDEFGTGSTEVYPNPFREQLSIEIPVETRQQIRVEVLDFQGKLITTLTDNMRQAGLHRISWNGKDRNETVVGNGIYFIRIHSAEKTELIKVMKVN